MKHLHSHSFVINRKDGPTAILISTDNFIKLSKLVRLVFGALFSLLIIRFILKKVKKAD